MTGERKRFSSAILPAWARTSPKVAEVLPLLYLHELSSGDFGPAFEQFLGSAAGLSASTVVRLTEQRQTEAAAFTKRTSPTSTTSTWSTGGRSASRAQLPHPLRHGRGRKQAGASAR